jgi:hypothetical protein
MYRPLDVFLTSGMGWWYADFDREILTKLDNKRSVARRASKNAEMRYFFWPLDNMIIIKTYYGGPEKDVKHQGVPQFSNFTCYFYDWTRHNA